MRSYSQRCLPHKVWRADTHHTDHELVAWTQSVGISHAHPVLSPLTPGSQRHCAWSQRLLEDCQRLQVADTDSHWNCPQTLSQLNHRLLHAVMVSACVGVCDLTHPHTCPPPPAHTRTTAGSEPLFSDVFQSGDLSVSVFQGSLVESIVRMVISSLVPQSHSHSLQLLETKKALRDDGLTAAVRHVQTHLERDTDLHVSHCPPRSVPTLTLLLCVLQVTKSLLHKACSQSTDLYTFSIALMKIDKTMVNYQNEVCLQ